MTSPTFRASGLSTDPFHWTQSSAGVSQFAQQSRCTAGRIRGRLRNRAAGTASLRSPAPRRASVPVAAEARAASRGSSPSRRTSPAARQPSFLNRTTLYCSRKLWRRFLHERRRACGFPYLAESKPTLEEVDAERARPAMEHAAPSARPLTPAALPTLPHPPASAARRTARSVPARRTARATDPPRRLERKPPSGPRGPCSARS
jgi:hypothetical protein